MFALAPARTSAMRSSSRARACIPRTNSACEHDELLNSNKQRQKGEADHREDRNQNFPKIDRFLLEQSDAAIANRCCADDSSQRKDLDTAVRKARRHRGHQAVGVQGAFLGAPPAQPRPSDVGLGEEQVAHRTACRDG